MILTCPGCAGRYSVEAFLTDERARATVTLAASLPAPLGDLTLRYLALFRPRQRALTWNRAHALLEELAGAIRAGQIERRGRAHPAPVEYWKAALEEILTARDRLNLPLKSHGYLYEIIAGMADAAGARQEQRRESRLRSGAASATGPVTLRRTDPAAAREHISGAIARLKGMKHGD